MSGIMEALAGQLGGSTTRQLSHALGGADETKVNTAIAAALPILMGALAKNSSQGSGAGSLASALDRDHDGSVLDDLAGFLGNAPQAESSGGAILGHLLGGRQERSAGAVSKMSGLDKDQAARILMMLAPVVLGYLGKQKRQQNLDAGGLAGLLAGERKRVEQVEPAAGSLLSSLLDQDGDGDMTDDLARMGAGFLGKLMKG